METQLKRFTPDIGTNVIVFLKYIFNFCTKEGLRNYNKNLEESSGF
jgi:hypothetical protein